MDVATLLDEWWAWKRANSSATAIVVSEQNIRFLKRDLGRGDVDDVTIRTIDKWHSGTQERGYAPRYARRIMSVLSAAYSKGVAWEICDVYPVKGAERPRIKTKVKAPTPETVRRALDWAREHDYTLYVFVRLAAVRGMRRSELVGLDRHDYPRPPATIDGTPRVRARPARSRNCRSDKARTGRPYDLGRPRNLRVGRQGVRRA